MIEILKSSKDLLAAKNENLNLKLHSNQEKFDKGSFSFKIVFFQKVTAKVNNYNLVSLEKAKFHIKRATINILLSDIFLIKK